MQPVQDLTVEDRVSRTQYQYSLEDADAAELNTWVPRFVEKLKALPELRDVASDQQNAGLQTRVVIDRDAASRFGITPQLIDDTLYDAFGQRQVSTMFTQLNQYHVVLEGRPELQVRASRSPEHLPAILGRRLQVPPALARDDRDGNTPLAVNHQGQFPVVDGVVQPRAGRVARASSEGD